MGLQPTAPVRAQIIELVALLLGVVVLAYESIEGDRGPSSLLIAAMVVSWASLAVRRQSPVLVLVIAVVVRLLLIQQVGSGLAMLPIVGVALYTVARYGDRRRGLLVAAGAAAVMSVIAATFGDDGFVIELLEEGAQAFLPIALGDAFRTRDDRMADLIDAEAEARVQAERLRIARDLHDVVAHGLSIIAIQSGVAARLLDTDTDQARNALEAINETGRASLDDLRSMVGALRSTDVVLLDPTPTDPDDLSAVVAHATAAGVDVRLTQTGAFPSPVGDAVVVAVHRIVQEALMNVARHAGAVPADLELRHGADELELRLVNPAGAGPALGVESTGVGIIGMRERAESVGGRLEAEPTAEGGFLVEAVLPYTGRPA